MSRLSFRLRAVLLIVFAGAVVWPACGFPAKNGHKHDIRAEVEAIDAQWRTAELNNDPVALEKLLSDDYIGVTAAGRVLTKEQQLDRVRSRQTKFERMDISDVKIRLAGQNVAVITSLTELDGEMEGHPVHGQFRSIRVFQRGPNGTWHITNFEATPLRAEPRPAGFDGHPQ